MKKVGRNLVQKILSNHLVSGQVVLEGRSAISVDQTLLHDVSGTMAALEFETLLIPRIRTKLSLMYIDHNTLQEGFENADDHIFLHTFALSTGSISHGRATASAIRSIWNGLRFQDRCSWVE